MCTVCGCGNESGSVGVKDHVHEHSHDHNLDHGHVHVHPAGDGEHDHGHHHDYSQGPARAHTAGLSQARMVQIEQDILGKNNEYAAANRRHFADSGLMAVNLLSGPGSGKTSLLTRTIDEMKGEISLTVIEGDQQSANDAERIRETGVEAIQINTGKGCHLDAHMVGHAVESLNTRDGGVLFIENVGNLVCPAAFDLGEAHKVVILSVTEGEDKPIKYPDMFHAADLVLLNKIDLLPYLEFDVERCIELARRVNPGVRILQVSATTGENMDQWFKWIRASRELSMIGR